MRASAPTTPDDTRPKEQSLRVALRSRLVGYGTVNPENSRKVLPAVQCGSCNGVCRLRPAHDATVRDTARRRTPSLSGHPYCHRPGDAGTPLPTSLTTTPRRRRMTGFEENRTSHAHRRQLLERPWHSNVGCVRGGATVRDTRMRPPEGRGLGSRRRRRSL
jgi:hypothetical protein